MGYERAVGLERYYKTAEVRNVHSAIYGHGTWAEIELDPGVRAGLERYYKTAEVRSVHSAIYGHGTWAEIELDPGVRAGLERYYI